MKSFAIAQRVFGVDHATPTTNPAAAHGEPLAPATLTSHFAAALATWKVTHATNVRRAIGVSLTLLLPALAPATAIANHAIRPLVFAAAGTQPPKGSGLAVGAGRA